jgi:CRISPR-associated protein Csb1
VRWPWPGARPRQFTLKGGEAVAILGEAVSAAKGVGLPGMEQELVLKPSPQLAELVRKSQDLAASTAGESEDDK